MKGRTLLTLALVASLVVPATAAAAVAGSPDFDARFTDNTVSPGEETALEVVLINSGDLDSSGRDPSLNDQVQVARGLTVELENESAPIDVQTPRQAVGTMPTGASEPIPFRVSVPDDAEPGTYDVELDLEYEYTSYISEGDGTTEEENGDETITMSVTVERTPQLSVQDVDSNLRVGGTGTVTMTVENTGERAARDATLTLTSPSQDVTFGQSQSADRYVESLAPGETRDLTFRATAADTADTEDYAFTLSGRHERQNGQTENITPVTVGVAPAPEQEFTVVDTGGEVAVGERGTYTVTLRNDGPAVVRDATVQLATQNAHITLGDAESGSRYVGTWEPGEERTVEFDLRASDNAQQQHYAMSASVNYEDEDGDANAAEGLSMGIVPGSEQTFAVQNVDGTLEVGDDGRLTGELVNTGDRPVEDVLLTWDSDQQNVNPTETEYSVGTLEPGEAAEFDFGVEVSEAGEPGPRQFSLVAEFDDADGDRRTSDSLNVRQEVAPQQDEFDVQIESANLSPGQRSTVDVRVTNADDETLTDVSAKLFADDPISTHDDEAFIAALEPGESETITFSVSAGSGALTKTYPLSMDFQYEEPDGDTVTSDTYNVPVEVEEPENDDGGGGPSLIAIGVAAVLGVLVIGGYMRFR